MHPHHTAHADPGSLGSLVPLLLIALAGLAYWLGVLHYKHQKKKWNHWRTLSFSTGVLLLFLAMLPAMMSYAHQDIRGHMVQHLLIGMLAPLGLVLGAPVTLALNIVPRRIANGITGILRSEVFHWLSHPVTAFLLNIGGMAVLYLSPLYTASLTNPILHYLIHVHFVLAGYLFTWSIVGPDPAPKRPTLTYRAVILFLSMATHAYLSKYMYAYQWPRQTPYSEEQIWAAAKIMYYGGDFSELLLTITLFAIWYQKRGLKAYKLRPLEAQ